MSALDRPLFYAATLVREVTDASAGAAGAVASALKTGDWGILLDTRYGVYAASLGATVLWPALRAGFTAAVSDPIGRHFILPRAAAPRPAAGRRANGAAAKQATVPALAAPSQKQLERLFKWNESAWKLFVYAAFVTVAVTATYKDNFFLHTPDFWRGCTTFPPCNYVIGRGIALIYVFELSFYLQAIPVLAFYDVRRKDYAELMAHHFATLGLVLYSWHVNFSRVGAMTFLCHDLNDVFLEGAKLARYARSEAWSTALFAAFAASWFVTRLFYFPLWIIWTAWHDPAGRIALPYGIDPDPHFLSFQTMLFFLLALHAYWSWLILKVLRKALKGKVEDVREEDESDSD